MPTANKKTEGAALYSFLPLLHFIRDIVCFVPLICVMPILMGIDGILLSAPIADFIAMAVTAVLTIVYFTKLKKNNNPKPKETAIN